MSRGQTPVPQSDADDSRTDGRHVGTAVERTDAPAKVRGEARYAMDIAPDDPLVAKLVTSPYAHADITRIDTTAAEELEGVAAVATHEDVPDTRRGQYILDQPILSGERVRYAGEPVAVVAAATEAIAEEAVSLVEVEYDSLEGVFDLRDAFSTSPAAVVHPGVRDYEFATQGDPRYAERGHIQPDDPDYERPNVLYRDSADVGDVDSAMAEADHVIEGEYEVRPIQHCAMEPHVAVAHDRPDETVIWSSQQVPHNIQTEVCMVYPDLQPSELTIKTLYVGGGFGGKITPFMETMLLAIARKVSRPVRLAYSRAEEFTSATSRPQVVTRVKDGVTDDGDLLAREVEMLFNCGAYNEQVFRCTCSGPSATVGAYAVPNVRWDSYAVYTNQPMAAAFRGFGKPEVNWGIERHMNHVAEELGLDPLEYRAKNLLREGDRNAKGEVLGPNDTEGCLRRPVERLEECDPEAELRAAGLDPRDWHTGRGFAYGNKPVSRAAAGVTVHVKRDMVVEVHAGAPDIGQGSDTMLTQLAAEKFDIPMEKVRLVTGDTDRTPYDRGPTGSRFTFHAGNALLEASTAAREKLFSQAATYFEKPVDPADLETHGEYVRVADDPERRVHVNELFSDFGQQVGVSNTMLREGGELIGTATFDSRRGSEDHAFWTPVGQAVLVAVSQVTGEVRVLRAVTAADVGRAINPQNVEQQLEGATAQGLSSAVYEEIVYDGGQVTNPNFKEYRVPGATELPYQNETIVIESYGDEGPYGAKGVGEMGMIASAPAVGNAVEDAVGVAFDTIPITPERVLPELD